MMEGTPRRSPFPSLTLVGTPRFRPFRNVWMLEELRDALPAEVGFRYDHTVAAPQSDEARAHHPMGKVPSLLVRDGTEGDFTLIESAAINSWLGDRMREYVVGGDSGFLVPLPGSRDRAIYDSFVQFLVAEADSSGLWIHRKLESLGEKKAFGAVRYALLPARLQFDRAMAGEDMCMGLQPVVHVHAHVHVVTAYGTVVTASTAYTYGYRRACAARSAERAATRLLPRGQLLHSGRRAARALLGQKSCHGPHTTATTRHPHSTPAHYWAAAAGALRVQRPHACPSRADRRRSVFPAQVHCCDWAAGIDADKGPAACWFSKYADDVVFQDYLGRMRARPAYLRAKQIQEDSPALA